MKKNKTGNIVEILPRKNELIRPAVANIDQALVVFAVTKPTPHFNLLDRFLVMMERKDIPVVLCFNKTGSWRTDRRDCRNFRSNLSDLRIPGRSLPAPETRRISMTIRKATARKDDGDRWTFRSRENLL